MFRSKQGNDYEWLDTHSSSILKSEDPYAALVSKVAEKVQKDVKNAEAINLDQFKKVGVVEGLTRLQPNLSKVESFDDQQYQVIRRKAIRELCEKDVYAIDIIKNSKLGSNNRYLNLLTDVFVNTFEAGAAEPFKFSKDFMLFSFLAFDAQSATQNTAYASYVQELIKTQMFKNPSDFSTLPGMLFTPLINSFLAFEISPEMYTTFMYIHMVKTYNFFGSTDKYFKELAKVFLELAESGTSYPAEAYQKMLNQSFFVTSENDGYVQNMKFDHQKVCYFTSFTTFLF